MLTKNHVLNIPEPKSNILRDSNSHNLTNLSSPYCSGSELNNLLLNSNLDDSNAIK